MAEQYGDDSALTRLVRAGDSRAVAELYERHHAAVLVLARRLCPDPQTAEDLASEAFTRTLRTVRTRAAGPSGGWRPYLYAVVRNTAAEWARLDQRLVLTAEFKDEEFADLLVGEPEVADDLVARAFRSLPPRWQTVLWHTLIEDEEPEQVARILGITPGNVSVLAFRAREGLRKAYLAAHVVTGSPECQRFADRLAAVVRKPGIRIPRALRAHLDACLSCTRALSELRDLNSALRAGLPIALLPLAMGKAAASKGASAGSLGWAIPTAAAAAVATAAVVAVMTMPPDRSAPPSSVSAAPTWSSLSSIEPTPVLKQSPNRTQQRAPERTQKPAVTPTVTPVTGKRITYAGRCAGAAGGQIAVLSCADPRTAWRTRGESHEFQLVNVVSGRCLAAGERYDAVAFNGGGMRAVRLASCANVLTQRWGTPRFSDGVPRLVNLPTGMALSIGKEFAGKRPPTVFILYGAYTGSADQRITLVADRD